MLYVSYDFGDEKRRGKFRKFLKKLGRRMQFSVYELKNSKRILRNVMTEVEMKYEPSFTKEDTVIIIETCEACTKKIRRYGYAANEECEVLFL